MLGKKRRLRHAGKAEAPEACWGNRDGLILGHAGEAEEGVEVEGGGRGPWGMLVS